MDLRRRVTAEFVGTALLLAAVVGSGIMAERLSSGNVALALLANSVATGAALTALILTLGPISGAHFNPAVSIADASQGGLGWGEALIYVLAQFLGALAGVGVADIMFEEPAYAFSTHVRSGSAQAFSEAIATFGLLAVIWGCSRRRSSAVPFAVAAYIVAAYWFTASTSFANPAVTLARAFTNTFAGIRPQDVPMFWAAQVAGCRHGHAAVPMARAVASSIYTSGCNDASQAVNRPRPYSRRFHAGDTLPTRAAGSVVRATAWSLPLRGRTP